jgi:hypothetical protein
MGRLCRKIGRGVKEALEGGADAVAKALREVRRKIRAKRKDIAELDKSIDGLEDGNMSAEAKRQAKEAYEKLKEKYQKELDDLERERRRLEDIQGSVQSGTDKIDEVISALEEQDSRLTTMSFIEAARVIETTVDEILFEDSGAQPPCDDDLAHVSLLTTVDVDYLADLLSDEGLDAWAESVGLPSPRSMDRPAGLAARTLYGAIAPGLDDMGFGLRDSKRNPVDRAIFELFDEAITRTSELPAELLHAERAYQRASAHRIAEYVMFDVAPGGLEAGIPLRGGDGAEARLRIQKLHIVGRRDAERNRLLVKGLLAVVGLDFVMDELDDDDTFGAVVSLLTAGLWLRAAVLFARLLWRVLRSPRLWERLVKRYGRFGALRFLAGLGGRLSPALLAGLIAYAWYDIFAEWTERKQRWDEELRKLYHESDAASKDEIFKSNLGYIPA